MNARKFLAWDIEIAALIPEGATIHGHRPLGITCAAMAWQTDAGDIATRVHFGRDDHLAPQPRMRKGECVDLVWTLQTHVQAGYTILGWNSLSFDFDVLAEESGMFDECRELAMNHVDPMFQLFCIKGYPLGLDTAAKGLGVQGKMEGVSGAKAPELWTAGEYDKVLSYVQQDVKTTLEVALAIEKQGGLTWISKSGRQNSVAIPRLLTVRESFALPEPDNSWQTNPMLRTRFTEWMQVKQPD